MKSPESLNCLLRIENAEIPFSSSLSNTAGLHDLNLILGIGERLAIFGPVGAGKTTLLRAISGLAWTRRGKIAWLGENGLETSRITGQKVTRLVSPILQDLCRRQSGGLTCLELLSGCSRGQPSIPTSENSNMDNAVYLLKYFKSEHLAHKAISTLSEGQLRLLLICQAFLAKPKVLLLDEALDGLDSMRKIKTLELLTTLPADTGLIFTAHREDGFPGWINSFMELHSGTLLTSSGPKFLKSVCRHEKGMPKEDKKSEPETSKEIQPRLALCRLSNVSVYIEREKILHEITWDIGRASHWRLSGPNGSGKSTLLRLLAGEEFAAAGGTFNIYDETGIPLPGRAAQRKAVSLIADLSQFRYDYDVKGWELVCTGIEGNVGVYRKYSAAEIDEARSCASRFFDAAEWRTLAEKSIRHCSTGQLRILFLARAIIKQPRLILLDEPCNGLDFTARNKFLDMLEALVSDYGNGWPPAIIFASHYEKDIPEWINQEARMDDGRLTVSAAL